MRHSQYSAVSVSRNPNPKCRTRHVHNQYLANKEFRVSGPPSILSIYETSEQACFSRINFCTNTWHVHCEYPAHPALSLSGPFSGPGILRTHQNPENASTNIYLFFIIIIIHDILITQHSQYLAYSRSGTPGTLRPWPLACPPHPGEFTAGIDSHY